MRGQQWMLCESHPLTQLSKETSELGLLVSTLVQIRNVTPRLIHWAFSPNGIVHPTPTRLTQRWQQIPGCGFLCLWNQRPLFNLFFLQRLPPSLSTTECLVHLFLCHCFAFALSNKVTITLILMTPLANVIYFIYTHISSFYYHPPCAPHVPFLFLAWYSLLLLI